MTSAEPFDPSTWVDSLDGAFSPELVEGSGRTDFADSERYSLSSRFEGGRYQREVLKSFSL